MKITSFITILFFLYSNDIICQEIKIVDERTGNPLENATLNSVQPRASIMTDVDGNVNVYRFKGIHKIYVRMLGYQTRILSYDELVSQSKILKLTPENTALSEVVVSITKWKQRKNKVPHSLVSIQQKAMTAGQPQTTADLLGQSGYIFVQKSQLGGGSPMIRGFSTNRVLLSVDGVRMNNAIFRSGNLQNVLSLDALSIEQTEVILGPGSVIYGSDAMGGVMNFFTLNPSFFQENDSCQTSGSVVSRWSSANNEKTGHFHLNIAYKKWAFLTSVTQSDYESLRMGSRGADFYTRPDYVVTENGIDTQVLNSNPNIQRESGYGQLNIMQKVRFKPHEKLDFSYGFHYATTTDFNRYDQLLRKRNNGDFRFAEWYYGPQEWQMHHLKIQQKTNSKWMDEIQYNAAYQRFGESRNSRNWNSNLRNSNIEKVDAYSLSVDFFKNIDSHQRFNYGTEYIYNRVSSTGKQCDLETKSTVPIASRYPNGSHWQSMAIYIQYENKISSKWTFQSGIRYNQIGLKAEFNDNFVDFPFEKTQLNTSAFTGSLGLIFEMNPEFFSYINFSSAFRSPNIDDVGKIFESTPGNVIVPNNNLKSEYAWNGELGITKKLGDILTFDAAIYYTILDNALVRRPFTLNGSEQIDFQGEISQVQAIQNAAKAYTYGFQTGANIKFTNKFHWKTSLNWNKGKEELDNGTQAPLRHSAPLFGESHLIFKSQKWMIDGFMVYHGKIAFEDLAPSEIEKAYLYAPDSNGNPHVPDWLTLNLRQQYQFNDTWSLNVILENITDVRYRPYSSGISAPGRNLILALKVNI